MCMIHPIYHAWCAEPTQIPGTLSNDLLELSVLLASVKREWNFLDTAKCISHGVKWCGILGQVSLHCTSPHTRCQQKEAKGGIGNLDCRLIISAVTLKMHKCCLNAIQEMQLAVIRARTREGAKTPPTNQRAPRMWGGWVSKRKRQRRDGAYNL